MEPRTIVGRWVGSYVYDPAPGLDAPPPTEFVLEVGRVLAGRFAGTVQDDPAVVGPEVGLVQGFLVGDRVEFVKRMPALYLWESGRCRHIAECVRAWWGMELDGPVPASPIHYEGTFVSDGNLAGRWWIDKVTVALPSGGQQYALDLGSASGRWCAARQAEPRAVPDR
jgi:hypothetical protein